MPTINVTTRSGERRSVSAMSGFSLMELLKEGGVDEIQALCGGCCSCATCHIYVDPEFAASFPPMRKDETDLLELSEHRRDTSRLACQIPFKPELDGLSVTVAPED